MTPTVLYGGHRRRRRCRRRCRRHTTPGSNIAEDRSGSCRPTPLRPSPPTRQLAEALLAQSRSFFILRLLACPPEANAKRKERREAPRKSPVRSPAPSSLAYEKPILPAPPRRTSQSPTQRTPVPPPPPPRRTPGISCIRRLGLIARRRPPARLRGGRGRPPTFMAQL